MSEQITAALVAAIVSAIVALTVAVAQLRHSKSSQRAQVQNDISTKYDKMVDYRLQYPEVLSLARHWKPECFERIYNQKTDEDKTWAIYYGYVELCIAYCNAVLYANDKKFLDSDLYKSEHEPLIRLLLAEHFLILSTIARPGKYVSKYLVQHIDKLQQAGWNWEAANQSLNTK